MGHSPTYHSPEGEECAASVEHGPYRWAEHAVGTARGNRALPHVGEPLCGGTCSRAEAG